MRNDAISCRRANVVRHQIRTGGAVHADGQQIVVGDGGVQCIDRLAAQHGAVAFDGDGGHHGDRNPEIALAAFATASRPALKLPVSKQVSISRIVGAAFHQPLGLLVVAVAELRKGDCAVMLRSLVVGPMEPATKRGLAGVENSSAAWRAILAAGEIQLVARVFQLVVGQHDAACRRRCWFR